MTDGKNAVGLKGFPTPNTAEGIAGYLLFLFEDKTYAQWILGGLEAMGHAYNWYKSGDMDPAEAAQLFSEIVTQAPYNLKTCANPAGGRILRVGPTGRVEELSDANTWQDPTGDYEIPPVPARTDGSPPDQICLASKNAANVLQTLYENVTDSFNEGLDETEAATALALGVVALIGAEFAPITFALVTFFSIVFSVLYGLLEFVGADLWNGDFTNTIVCILQECATNVDGVVTFDYACFNEKLAAQVNIFDLTFAQLRLFGQLQYLLLVIGGVDALNHAGATTAITDDDCSFCPSGGSICVTFDDGDPVTFVPDPEFPLVPAGHLNTDFGNPLPSGHSDLNFSYGNYQLWVGAQVDLGGVFNVTDVNFQFFWYSDSAGGSIFRGIYFLDNDGDIISQQTEAGVTAQSEWLDQIYTGDPVAGVRYVVAVLGQTSGATITGELSVDNICAAWDG